MDFQKGKNAISEEQLILFDIFQTFSSAGNDQITIQGNIIKRVATMKYLGFLIHENLSWKNHSSAIAEKSSRGLGVMQRTKNLVPKKILKMIHFSRFRPYISYRCSIWASNFVTCIICNSKRVQNFRIEL